MCRHGRVIRWSSFVPSGSETVQCGMTDLLQTMFLPEKRVCFGCGYKKAEKALETYLKKKSFPHYDLQA